MTVTKNKIVKNISKNIQISESEALMIADAFFGLIKSKISKNTVKLSSFGSFYEKKTPKRLGRNPKTKQEHIIVSMKKPVLKVSELAKKILN